MVDPLNPASGPTWASGITTATVLLARKRLPGDSPATSTYSDDSHTYFVRSLPTSYPQISARMFSAPLGSCDFPRFPSQRSHSPCKLFINRSRHADIARPARPLACLAIFPASFDSEGSSHEPFTQRTYHPHPGPVPAITLAGLPTDPKEQARLIGQPTSLEVKPATVNLDGPRAGQQLVVTGKYADGTVRDLTAFAAYTTNETPDLLETAGGFIRGKRNANTQLDDPGRWSDGQGPGHGGEIRHAAAASASDTTSSPDSNVGGCNAGACHGTPSGKNGFRLSLRGFDPALGFHPAHPRRLGPAHR